MFKIDLIAGARPNFMKIGPIHHALQKFADKIQIRVVHTGQHYDQNMSTIFFEQLGLPKPDISLNIGSATHAHQTGKIMMAYEDLIIGDKPDLLLVVGDVNSTMACALVAAKLNVPVGHVEAGLRSFDWEMPEEVNRVVADRVSNFLFTTCDDGDVNLIREGFDTHQIVLVGNTMIDSLFRLLPQAEKSKILKKIGVKPREYVLTTLHRPSNVDNPDDLRQLMQMLVKLSKKMPIVFPVHPRTKNKMIGLEGIKEEDFRNIHLTEPLSYLDFVKCQKEAFLVVTDSGGVQEETSALGVQCLTARENTERPVTITKGTNRLVGTDPDEIYHAAVAVLNGDIKAGIPIPLWDGNAGERIADYIMKNLVNAATQ